MFSDVLDAATGPSRGECRLARSDLIGTDLFKGLKPAIVECPDQVAVLIKSNRTPELRAGCEEFEGCCRL